MGIDLNTINLGAQTDQQLATDKESNTNFIALPGFLIGNYGDKEARMALAFGDAVTISGGGGTSAATIAAGIDLSVDIDTMLATLADIETNTDTAGLASGIDASSDIDSILAALNQIEQNTQSGPGPIPTAIVDVVFTASGVNQVASAANAATSEIFIQNKSSTDNVYIRNNGVATPSLSITLFPGANFIFSGFEAKQAINAITDGTNVDLYIKRTNV